MVAGSHQNDVHHALEARLGIPPQDAQAGHVDKVGMGNDLGRQVLAPHKDVLRGGVSDSRADGHTVDSFATAVDCSSSPEVTINASSGKIGRASCRERVCQYV